MQEAIKELVASCGAGLQSCGRRPRRPVAGLETRCRRGRPPHYVCNAWRCYPVEYQGSKRSDRSIAGGDTTGFCRAASGFPYGDFAVDAPRGAPRRATRSGPSVTTRLLLQRRPGFPQGVGQRFARQSGDDRLNQPAQPSRYGARQRDGFTLHVYAAIAFLESPIGVQPPKKSWPGGKMRSSRWPAFRTSAMRVL